MMPAPRFAKIGFRKIEATHPEVKELQDAIVNLVADLNARLVETYFYALPIGTPIPFLADLFPPGFDLGPKYLPMDGRVVEYAKSPLNGRALDPPNTDLGVGAEWWCRVLD